MLTKEQLWVLIESYHVAHIAHGQRTVSERRAVVDAALTELFAQEPVGVVGTVASTWTASTHDGKWNPPGDPVKMVHLFKDVPLGTPLFLFNGTK